LELTLNFLRFIALKFFLNLHPKKSLIAFEALAIPDLTAATVFLTVVTIAFPASLAFYKNSYFISPYISIAFLTKALSINYVNHFP